MCAPAARDMLRRKDQMEGGHDLVRAEFPGIDPVRDVEITTDHGQLTIEAGRMVTSGFTAGPEFGYGPFVGALMLTCCTNEHCHVSQTDSYCFSGRFSRCIGGETHRGAGRAALSPISRQSGRHPPTLRPRLCARSLTIPEGIRKARRSAPLGSAVRLPARGPTPRNPHVPGSLAPPA
jgi:hypothetical protein